MAQFPHLEVSRLETWEELMASFEFEGKKKKKKAAQF